MAHEFRGPRTDVFGEPTGHLIPARRPVEFADMIECVLVMAETVKSASCPGCGEQALWTPGPRLVCAESGDAVCRDCAKVHAPQLIALVDLAQTADKVGRHSRHLL